MKNFVEEKERKRVGGRLIGKSVEWITRVELEN
jgi:hypothetical protein